MATHHEYIDNLISGRLRSGPANRAEQLRLESEIRAVQKTMLVLPTARESDALPELHALASLSHQLASDPSPALNALLIADEALRAAIVGELFEHVCRSVIKVRIYNNKEIVRAADALFCNLVIWATRLAQHDFREVLELLAAIIDKGADYYKNNGKEPAFAFPFGEQLQVDEAHRDWVESLKEGDSVDALKNYGGKRVWSRAVIIAAEYSMLKVRFVADTYEAYVQGKFSELARPGSRSSDFEWRQSLQAGDTVDFFNLRQDWTLCKVAGVTVETNSAGEEVRTLKLSRLDDDTTELDSLMSIRAQSPALAQPGRFSTRSGGIDDSEDASFLAMVPDTKYAIMRSAGLYNSSSIFLIKYINLFGAAGGFDTLLEVLSGSRAVSQDVLGLHVRLIQASSDYLVEPFIRAHGKPILKSIRSYILLSSERNLRDLSQANLTAILEGVACLASRVYPADRARKVSDELRLSIALLCLNSEFLEKQFFGAKVIASIEQRLRTRESDFSKAELAKRIADAGIFERVVKGHSSLVAKSAGILNIMFTENAITEQQLDFLWTEIGKTDMDSRAALLGVLKDALWNFSREEVRYFVGAIRKKAEALVDVELFELLFALKRVAWNRHADSEVVASVNEVLWAVLQSQAILKEELRKEIIKNFIKFLQEDSGEGDYGARMVEAVLNNENVAVNLKILGKILKLESTLSYKLLEQIEAQNVLPTLLADVTQRLEAGPRAGSFERELKFIDTAMRLADARPLVAFEDVEKLWAVVFDKNVESEPVLRWLKKYIMRESEAELLPQLHRFFDENVTGLLQPGKSPFFTFFVLLFFRINMAEGKIVRERLKVDSLGAYAPKPKFKHFYLLHAPVSQLSCFGALWDVFLRASDESLERQVGDFVVKVHCKPEFAESRLDAELYDSELAQLQARCLEMYSQPDLAQVRKASVLLDRLMKREERFGFGPLKSYASLKEGEKIVIEVEKNIKYFKERFRATFSSNSTLSEVRERVAREYRVAFGLIELRMHTAEGRELTALDNSSTLEELGVKMRDLLIFDEKEVPEPQEAPLLDPTGQNFTPRALSVFREVFGTYSKNGRMSRQDMASFTMAATENINCLASDPRINAFFSRYDPTNTGYVSFDDFAGFYLESALVSDAKVAIVRENLQSLGYGKDLRLRSEDSPSGWPQSARYALASNPAFSAIFMQRVGARHVSALERTFIDGMTPPFDYLRALIADPLKVLREAQGNPQMLEYCLTVLDALVFRHELLAELEEAVDIGDTDSCAKRVFSAEFAQVLFSNVDASGNLPLRFAEKWLRVLAESKSEGFIRNTANFLAYSVLSRKKQDAPAITETKDADAQTEKLGYGPHAKNSAKKEKEDEEAPGDEETSLQSTLSKLNKVALAQLSDSLDYTALNTQLIEIIAQASTSQDELGVLRRNRLRSALIALLGSLILRTTELDVLFDEPSGKFKHALVAGLSHKKTIARLHYKNFYAYLTSAVSELKHKTTFLKLLIESLKAEDLEEAHVLLELASNLLGEISEARAKADAQAELHGQFDFGALFAEFSAKLEAAVSKETAYDGREDNSLCSILIFMERLLRADPLILTELPSNERQRLALYLFKKCLFDVSASALEFSTPKCKSAKSRNAALDLLRELCANDARTQINIMLAGYGPLSAHLPDFTTIGTTAAVDRKSAYGYVGIRNPGCICYMNAMLQQFYCTPAFRYAMLLADDKTAPQPYRVNDAYAFDDNIFHQLQRMFAYLDRSQRPAYNPAEFCGSYKDFSGERVNVMVQQDAQEFLNVIFEKIEKAIKPTPYYGMLNSVFSGKTCNVFTCKGCGFVRSNEEMFYNISLEVKNLDNLVDSFNKYITPETISDFACDNCKAKCDVTKQCFLKQLPNVLIVHLQKIVFDVEALMNIKLASRFEFGHSLDLQKYVYLEPGEEPSTTAEQYAYKLVGVVVHRGNAEFGHYTSLINVNRGDPSRPTSEDVWLDFDDSRISRFNMEGFDEECFGSDEKEFGGGMLGVEAQMSKSAYILVYDKVLKGKLSFTVDSEHSSELDKIKANLINKDDFAQHGEICETDFHNLGGYVPRVYADDIDRDNNNLLLEQQVLSAKFCNTLADIVGSAGLPATGPGFEPTSAPDKYTLTLADLYLKTLPVYLFRVFCASSENYRVGKLVKAIEGSLALHRDKAFKFFGDNVFNNLHYLMNLLINSTDALVRGAVADFIVMTITATIRTANVSLDVELRGPYEALNPSERTIFILQSALDKFLGYIPAADPSSPAYRKHGAYFYALHRLIVSNPTVAVYCVRYDVLKALVELYMCHEPTRISSHEKALTGVLSCISALLKLQKMMEANGDAEPSFASYASAEMLHKIMREDYKFNNYEGLRELIDLMATDNLALSQELAYLALRGLSSATDSEVISYLETLKALLRIKDDYTAARLPLVFGYARLWDTQSRADERGYYSYGLIKDNSLKKQIVQYPSTFGGERGMLDELTRTKEMNEASALLIIFYILDVATECPHVADYLLSLPPACYLSNSAIDWFGSYVNSTLESFAHSYAAPRAELQYLYFNHLGEKLRRFEQATLPRLPAGVTLFGGPGAPVTYCASENYLIGKTVQCSQLANVQLENDIWITVTLVRLSMRKSRGNGDRNEAIPQSALAFDYYVNKAKSLDTPMEAFMGYTGDKSDAETEDRLQSLVDDDDEEPQAHSAKSVRKYSDSVPVDHFFFNDDAVMRVALDNRSDSNYFVRVRVEGNKWVQSQEAVLPIRARKGELTVFNLTKSEVAGDFKGVSVSVELCSSGSVNFKYYSEEEMSDAGEVYVHE